MESERLRTLKFLEQWNSKGIRFLHDAVTAIDVISKTVTIGRASNLKLEYDYLVIALGTEFALEEVNGFSENGGINLYDADQIPSRKRKTPFTEERKNSNMYSICTLQMSSSAI